MNFSGKFHTSTFDRVSGPRTAPKRYNDSSDDESVDVGSQFTCKLRAAESKPWKNKKLTSFGNRHRFGLRATAYGATETFGFRDCQSWSQMLEACKQKAAKEQE